MEDKDRPFGRFPRVLQELGGRRLKKPGIGGAIGRVFRTNITSAIETTKLPGQVLKGKKWTPEEAVNFSLFALTPSKGGGFGSGVRVKIPKFKNTNEAIKFGQGASPETVVRLQKIRSAFVRKLEGKKGKKRSIEELQKDMELGTKGQFYREAYEAGTKTGGVGDFLKKEGKKL